MIDVLLLGTSGMHPTTDRWLSAVLLRCGGELILFDCGEGTQIPWRRSHWGFRKVSTICVTHRHADHIAGLPGVLFSISNAGRTEPVRLYGPVGVAEVVQALRVVAPDLSFSLEVIELKDGDTFALRSGLVGRVASGEHGFPVLAYRLDLPRARRFDRERAESRGVPRRLWGRIQSGEDVAWSGGSAHADELLHPPRRGIAFGFITDTRPLPAHSDLVRDVDLLICEGTYGDPDDGDKAQRWGHMTFGEAATVARDAHVGHLWLTHFSPGMLDPEAWRDQATTIFPDTTIGTTGLATTISFPTGE